RICSAERHDRTMFNQFLAQRERDRANYRSMSAPFSASELARTVADAHELLVILMLVKKARYLSFQRLPRIKGSMRAVEQFPLKLGRDGIPPHDHGRPQALQHLLLFEGGVVVVLLPAANHLIRIERHPFCVFGKRRVALLQIAEFTRFLWRMRCGGENCSVFGCFRSVLL